MTVKNHRTIVGLTVAALSIGAPAASAAGPATGAPPPHGVTYSSIANHQPTEPTGVRVVRVTSSNPGFDWGDAGIGAGAVVALGAIGLGAGVLTSARRHRSDRPATAV